MPKTSQRLVLLRKIDARILELEPIRFIPSARRHLAYLVSYRHKLLKTRYLGRFQYLPVTAVHHPDSAPVMYMEMRAVDHCHAFRMTPSELDRLVDMFGDHEVFMSTGRRPQAPPRVQLGLLVHRLAHGHCTATIARNFGLSRGSVHQFTVRASIAIVSRLNSIIAWPDRDRREVIKQRILDDYGIPHCLGYLDGVNINLDRAPSQGPASGSYHSRKERYGFNLLAVCDHQKRFTFIHWGFSARSSDMRLQAACGLENKPEQFFSPAEFVLADSGFKCTANIIPMFKRAAGQSELPGRREFFNSKASPARVSIEHAFGILKGRWQFLRNAKLRLKTARDEAQAYAMIQAAFVLHNLTISTYDQFLSPEDVRALRVLEESNAAAQETDDRAYESVRTEHRRRERLVDDMLAYEPAWRSE